MRDHSLTQMNASKSMCDFLLLFPSSAFLCFFLIIFFLFFSFTFFEENKCTMAQHMYVFWSFPIFQNRFNENKQTHCAKEILLKQHEWRCPNRNSKRNSISFHFYTFFFSLSLRVPINQPLIHLFTVPASKQPFIESTNAPIVINGPLTFFFHGHFAFSFFQLPDSNRWNACFW